MNDIISQTRYSMNQIPKLLEKVKQLPEISKDDYYRLHRDYLVPLDIKIDPDQFIKELAPYEQYMRPWGIPHKPMQRDGIALVNETGKLDIKDRSIGSLSAWTLAHPDDPLLDTDFRVPTEILNLPSLNALRVFDGLWTKSAVLKWGKDAEFVPHIDTLVPAYWYRLWAAMNPNDTLVEFHNNGNTTTMINIEPGRLYLIDTSIVHYGKALADNVYQLFLSVDPSATALLDKLINTEKY